MTKFTVRKFNKRDSTLRNKIQGAIGLNQSRISILLLGVIIFASLSYLFYINETATGGFDIKGIETKIEQLAKDNKQLELDVAQLQSLGTIEAAGEDLELVATSYIKYLPAVGTTVAQR